MDAAKKVLKVTSTLKPDNNTEFILVQTKKVQTISIIIWVIGGVLLLSLLCLLARILLAKRKYRRAESPHMSTISPNVFRIRIDTQYGRHDGFSNPIFSTHDEIWNWIPDVSTVHQYTSNSCQDNATAGTHVTIQSNGQSISVSPPPYSEVVCSNSSVTPSVVVQSQGDNSSSLVPLQGDNSSSTSTSSQSSASSSRLLNPQRRNSVDARQYLPPL